MPLDHQGQARQRRDQSLLLVLSRRLLSRPLPLRERACKEFQLGETGEGWRTLVVRTPHPHALVGLLTMPSPARGEGAIMSAEEWPGSLKRACVAAPCRSLVS